MDRPQASSLTQPPALHHHPRLGRQLRPYALGLRAWKTVGGQRKELSERQKKLLAAHKKQEKERAAAQPSKGKGGKKRARETGDDETAGGGVHA